MIDDHQDRGTPLVPAADDTKSTKGLASAAAALRSASALRPLDSAVANSLGLAQQVYAATQSARHLDNPALRELQRIQRLTEALTPPKWLTAELEGTRMAEMQAAYARYAQADGLAHAVLDALDGVDPAAFARTSGLSPRWSASYAAVAGSLAPHAPVPASVLPSNVELHALQALRAPITEKFGWLSSTALDLGRMLDGYERGRRDADALFAASAVSQRAWDDVTRLSAAATRAWDVFGGSLDRLAVVTPRLAATPLIEVYAASRAATLVSPPDLFGDIEPVGELEGVLDEIGDEFEARLAALDPALVTMWRGGVERIEAGGTDWARQALTSFRELTTHTLHLLAPDAEFASWAKPEHYDKGRPTRKGRLQYIVREVAVGDLADFLAADLKGMLALFDLMHTVHKKAPALTRQQLRVVQDRVRGAVAALLEAAGR